MAKILVIEDEQALQLLLEYDLKSNEHQVIQCLDGQEGLDRLRQESFDIALIDWMLPSLSGYDIIKEIREEQPELIIIMLTAKDGEMDIVKGLEAGADDYLSKPFSSRELNARIKALLRKVKRDDSNIIKFSDIVIDQGKRSVSKDNEIIDLTKIEFDLLLYLIKNEDIVITRESINEALWGHDNDVELRVIDVHISTLKKKLEIKNNIITKRGVGYLFTK